MKKVPPRPWGKILKVSDPGGGARPSPPWGFNGSLSLLEASRAHTPHRRRRPRSTPLELLPPEHAIASQPSAAAVFSLRRS